MNVLLISCELAKGLRAAEAGLAAEHYLAPSFAVNRMSRMLATSRSDDAASFLAVATGLPGAVGPPRWSDARFDFRADGTRLQIHVHC